MSLIRSPVTNKCVHNVTPENADWEYVGFQVLDLEIGDTFKLDASENETCLIVLSGKVDIETASLSLKAIGERETVFQKINPHAVYVPWKMEAQVKAFTKAELAIAKAPGADGFPARHLPPENMPRFKRGKGSNTRYICNILMMESMAHKLLVTEVLTPAGNWSSYPPHRHDVDALPHISYLEETYYHRINPSQGFAFQKIYTDDESLDETFTIKDRDVVLVPRGYHPCGAPHGYDLYYLNTMAGPTREWAFKTDPNHEWLE